jgi:hypothetical protein
MLRNRCAIVLETRKVGGVTLLWTIGCDIDRSAIQTTGKPWQYIENVGCPLGDQVMRNKETRC